jgi:hypothetical protein
VLHLSEWVRNCRPYRRQGSGLWAIVAILDAPHQSAGDVASSEPFRAISGQYFTALVSVAHSFSQPAQIRPWASTPLADITVPVSELLLDMRHSHALCLTMLLGGLEWLWVGGLTVTMVG